MNHFKKLDADCSLYVKLKKYTERGAICQFLSGGFVTAIEVNPPEKEDWQNAPLCTSDLVLQPFEAMKHL